MRTANSAHTSAETRASGEAIHSMVKEQADAWNRNDAENWTKDFLEGADFINVRGDLIRGRAAIEKIHNFIFSGPYKESYCAVEIENLSFPAPNIAIADMTTEVTNFKNLPPGVAPSAAGVLRTRLKFILLEQEGVWKILSAQNTAIAPQPMPFS